ncbi:MAG: hypothetical protein RQ748_07715 [Elusimicrobiales bacterium]|nr:hypothetical protein [Elusimicrobiales bacterium]
MAAAGAVMPAWAAGQKAGGVYTIVDDAIGGLATVETGADVPLPGKSPRLAGFIGNLGSEVVNGAGMGTTYDLGAGFHSHAVSTPNAFGYVTISSDAFDLSWLYLYDPGMADYLVLLSTTGLMADHSLSSSTYNLGAAFSGLTPNTTYFAYLRSGYMESDYSEYVTTSAVTTLSMPVSSDTFVLANVGSFSANLRYSAFGNPGPVQSEGWSPGDPLASDLYGHASAVVSSRAFVSGGYDGVNFSSAVYYAEAGSAGYEAWSLAGWMPEGRYGHAMVTAKGRLYVIGGYDNGGTALEVWSADASTPSHLSEWREEEPFPYGVYLHAAVSYDDSIFVMGGFDGANAVSGVRTARLSDDGSIPSWDLEPATLPYPLYAFGAAELGGRIYISGGKDGASARTGVWQTAIDGDGTLDDGGWSSGEPLPSPRFAHTMTAMGDRLMVAGGNNGFAAQATVIMAAAGESGTMLPWTLAYTLPAARQYHSALKSGGRVYIHGGNGGLAASADAFSAPFSGTEYQARACDAAACSGAVSHISPWMPDFAWEFAGLLPDQGWFFTVRSRNWLGQETAWSDEVSTYTYAAAPSSAPWTTIGISSLTANWATNGNPVSTLYNCQISSMSDFSPLSGDMTTDKSSAAFAGLLPSVTYYARVRALDGLGRRTAFTAIGPQKTLFNPALDVNDPAFTDNQGDDYVWRSTNTYAYDVDMEDDGGSLLSYFEVRVATDTGGAGDVSGWVTAVTGINSDNYSDDWPIPWDAWDALPEGATGYVSARAFDGVGRSSTAVDLFSILKDTTAPAIALLHGSTPAWQSQYPGDPSADFSDYVSGLSRLQYSVSPLALSGDGSAIPWTDIGTFSPGDSEALGVTWNYDFTRLSNATTNYFSLRAVDVAGGTRTLTDAFYVMKNVAGPVVTISTPTGTYLSTFTLVQGYNTETAGRPVMETQVFVRDRDTGLYWDGADFISASRLWHVAAGTYPFVFEPAGITLEQGHQYEAVARSSDTLGDFSQAFATATFTYDALPPSAGVIFPADGGTADSPLYISGTAADAVSSVSAVRLALKRVSDGRWWDGASWQAAHTELLAGTTAEWTYGFNSILRANLAHQASYYATVLAHDSSYPRNEGTFFVYGSTFVYRDTTPPGAVTDLAAAQGALPGTMRIEWSAPGDDGGGGLLLSGGYAVHRATWSGADFSTAAAQVSVSTSNITAGSAAGLTIAGLQPSASYYFSLWTRDDAGNWSAASNVAGGETSSASPGFISGAVTQASGDPVQGVLVDVYSADGLLKAGDSTDAFGAYEVTGLEIGEFTVRATWSADDIVSFVSKDGIPSGTLGVDFALSVSYQLASVSGTIPAAFTASASQAGIRTASSGGTGLWVEVYKLGRLVARTEADAAGRFSISNLLPGTYSLRAYNGKEYTDPVTVKLAQGQEFLFRPVFSTLIKDRVFAYPNPARTRAHIHFDSSFALGSLKADIAVFDLSGRLVKRFSAADASNDTDYAGAGYRVTWDLARDNVAPGIYFYSVEVEGTAGEKAEKVVRKLAVIR